MKIIRAIVKKLDVLTLFTLKIESQLDIATIPVSNNSANDTIDGINMKTIFKSTNLRVSTIFLTMLKEGSLSESLVPSLTTESKYPGTIRARTMNVTSPICIIKELLITFPTYPTKPNTNSTQNNAKFL